MAAKTSGPLRRGMITSSKTSEMRSRWAVKISTASSPSCATRTLISLRRQHGLRHLANARMVVGEQNRFNSSANRRIVGNGRSKLPCRGVFIDRKKDPKCAPVAGLAFHLNKSVMLFDDAVDGRKSQAGALSRSLGGEERLEDPLSCGGIHAGTRVAHSQFGKASRLESRIAAAVLLGKLCIVRFDGDPPALGHGVA